MEAAQVNGGGAIEARKVEPGRGWEWWPEAWALFMRSPLLWVALALIVMVAFGVIGLVPLLGTLATAVLLPAVAAGWLLAARKVEAGGALEVGDLLAGFQGERMPPLLTLGAGLAGALLIVVAINVMLGAGALVGAAMGGMHRGGVGRMPLIGMGLLTMLVVFTFVVVSTAALWFAPALVVFRRMAPLDAVKASLSAVLRNWLPFLVYGLIQIGLSIVASIPFALGWLLLMPVMLLTVYVSYKDVFGA
ncbi:MAG TPA: BPSS1780 family membrane protein [Burkholderiaceae bacterium]|nr:BPSS1780 family membrane protein [Burkholderiaceae bacterium]